MSWLSNYKYRRKIKIDSSNIDSDLSHFPLPVPIGTSVGMSDQDVTDIFDEVGSDYLKIAATMDDGETQLYVEVEQWDATNEKALLWVSRDTWSVLSASDTEIYLYFDSTAGDNTAYVGTPGSRTEVWSSDFAAVYTMAQDPSGGADCIIDSTGNSNHGTPSGAMTSGDLVDGQIGKAIEFDGTNDYIDCGSGSELSFTSHISLLSSFKTTTDSVQQCINKRPAYEMHIESNNEVQIVLWIGGTIYRGIVSGVTVNDGNWHRIAGTFDGSIISCYVDGGNKATTAKSGNIDTTSNAIALASQSPDYEATYFLSGQQSNNLIAGVCLSDAWIKADYHAQTDNLLAWGTTEEDVVGYFDGYITYLGQPAKRKINLHRESTGKLVNSTNSSSYDGYYSLQTYYNEEHYLVCLATSGTDYNDQILGSVYPKLY